MLINSLYRSGVRFFVRAFSGRGIIAGLAFATICFAAARAQHLFPILPQTGNYQLMLLAVDDFNHDGHADALAISFGKVTNIVLLLGDGHGNFGAPKTVIANAGDTTNQLIVGDFNHDGSPDIAYVTANNQVQVYLNNGNGTFHTASPTGVLTTSMDGVIAGAVGDFNGDGKLDLVVEDYGFHRSITLLGKGDGTFEAPIVSNVPANSNGGPVVAGNLRGAGVLDLALGNGKNIQLLLGNGKGNFTIGPSIKTHAVGIDSLIAADLRNNGKLDLIAATGVYETDTACNIGPGVAVLTPGSNDSWSEIDYPTGIDAESVAAADMNGDGKLDLVVANQFSASISVLINTGKSGSGLFAPAVDYVPGPSEIYSIFVKDVNGDGKPDILFTPFNGELYTVLNQGGGRLAAGNSIELGLTPTALLASDLNHDGITDLAVVAGPSCPENVPSQFISLLSAKGKALATRHTNYSNLSLFGLGLGDINGDGRPDAVLSDQQMLTQFTALLNNGSGDFTLAPKPITDSYGDNFAVGNFNSDKFADIATVQTLADSNQLLVIFGEGNGQFGSPATYNTGSKPVWVAQKDVNGDSHADLVVANSGDNTVSVFLGSANGTFSPGVQYPAGPSPMQVVFADFNKDGKMDMAVLNPSSVTILLGNGNGTFSAPHTFPVGPNLGAIAAADFTGDGNTDIVAVTNQGLPYMYVLSGNGKGSLGPAVRYTGSDSAGAVVTGDFNGDGKIDIAVENLAGTGVAIFYNQGGSNTSEK